MLRDDRQVALGEVVVACKHAADQYREEAGLAEDRALERTLGELAARREEQALSLEAHIRALGDLPREPDVDRETVSGLLTRLRTHFAANARGALLSGAIESEQELAARIDEALREDLPEQAAQALRHLREDVASTIRRVRDANPSTDQSS